MSSKEGVCFRILKKYGFIIDGPKSTLAAIGRLPAEIEGETFKQWKERIFKENGLEITVYAPYEPKPQTRISTLARESGGEHLKKIFSRYGKFKDKKLEEAVEETEQDVIEMFSTFPKETLASLLDEFEGNLQPSVEEFFENYINSTEENLDTENLLRDLIKTYNDAVTLFRRDMIEAK